METKQSRLISNYALLQGSLEALDTLDAVTWPKLEERDTYQKSTEQRRTPGDSQMEEGILWCMGVLELLQLTSDDEAED
ncbi:hypothetical protein V5O48_006515 [Marasmius crinis-equi]|uniref:Uncharacterized protein n=1 Tax=Marasmius crinis-equi TaxID=585013 RepID=A0ABR3FJI5_9AGAR